METPFFQGDVVRREDYLIALGLTLLAVFIWLRDTAWVTSSDDTLPILIALPLFVWLGAPWQWRQDQPNYSTRFFATGVYVFVAGIGLNITLLLTAGWIIFLCVWLRARLKEETLPHFYKLLILPMMAFPWISLDFDRIGWWFRLSGAWVAQHAFAGAGFNVIREGTLLNINGLPISIEVACAGLNTLQSMLISGCIIAYITLGDTKRYWLCIPILIIMAWIANTIRILVISLLAIIISPAFVMGPFHIWGGWGVLMLMFMLSWLTFSFLEPKRNV